jgi:iron complex outermembrane recepter protein
MKSIQSRRHLSSFGKTAVLAIFASVPWMMTTAQMLPAPESSGDGQIIDLQAVTVTGTNLVRADAERALPISLIRAEQMDLRQAFTPVEMLTSLPQLTNLPENETRLGSSGARGDHTSISIRTLNADSTLILINGRRMAPNPMTPALNHSININHLPTQGIERIEVLRDGASAIYGSDAIGGVINYVMRRDFEGTQVKLRYGYPDNGGGEYVQGAVLHGMQFAEGRGRWLTNFDYMYRDAIFLTQRNFSRTANQSPRFPEPFNNINGTFNRTSANGIWPRFRVLPATGNNYFRPVDGVPTLTNVAPTRTANPEYYLDINQYGMANPRSSRGNWYNQLEFDLGNNLTAFAETTYYRSRSQMRRQPMWLNAPVTDQMIVMSIDNPYNPYGSRFYHVDGAPTAEGALRLTGNPSEVGLLSQTVQGLAAEDVRTKADVYRLLAGIRGVIGETWKWEAAVFRNQVKGKDEAYNDVRESKLKAAAARTDATAYNPFGYTFKVQGNAVIADQPYTNPQSVIDTFSEVYFRDGKSSITSADLKANGRVITAWAGDIMLAVGAEYREEALEDIRPPFGGLNPENSGLNTDDNDFLLHPPRPDVFGDRQVKSGYAEFAIPLASPANRWPMLHSLEANLSVRHENYSDFGDITRMKYGLNWDPFAFVRLRGSINEGFKAPSLSALYTSSRWTISGAPGTVDSYRNPVLVEGPYINRTYFGGNPNLKAAKSKGKTVGIVLDVPWVKGLTLTADYWEIKQDDLIGQRSDAQVRASDTALITAYTLDQVSKGVSVDQINVGSGTADYKGDPDVIRYAPTVEDIAGFAAYNAANPNNPRAVAGRIFSTDRPFLNLSSGKVAGWDFVANYSAPATRWGRFSANSEWTHLTQAYNSRDFADRGTVITNNLGLAGSARWRGNMTLNWSHQQWSAGIGAYYIGSVATGTTTSQAVYESLGKPSYIKPIYSEGRWTYRYALDSVTTFNAMVSYKFESDANYWVRDTSVRLGVVNLFDKEPPPGGDNFGYDNGVHGHMVVGRTWTVELTRKF